MGQYLLTDLVLGQYDLFFLQFYTLYFKQVINQKQTFTHGEQLPSGAQGVWMDGRVRITAGLHSGKETCALLSDRLCAGVKINVYLNHTKEGFRLQFQVSPTYMTNTNRKKLERKVIPALQAAKFEVRYP